MKTLIHIGLGKAGSTTLQKNIFEKLDNINYLTIKDQSIIDILYLNSLEFKKKYNSRNFDSNSQKNTIISCETLSFGGVFDQFIVCDRLNQIFKNQATILLIIRNQFDWIKSFYLEQLAGGIYVSFDKFLKQQFLNKEISIFPKLNYYNLVSYYKKVFGNENVKVFLFEEMFKRREYKDNIDYNIIEKNFGFTFKSNREINVENISIPSQLVPLKCLTNYLFRYDNGNGKFHIGTRSINEKKPKISLQYINKLLSNRFYKNKLFLYLFKKKPLYMNNDYRKKIFELFSNSNSKLESEYNLNLKINNYPIL